MAGKKVNAHLEQLIGLLDNREELTTRQIMEILSVSESTARRLIHLLARREDMARTFGGVCRVPAGETEYRYEQLEKQSQSGKRTIAQRALSLIQNGDVLYIDGGTTNACLAAALCDACRTGKRENITVFTNSLVTLNLLSSVCNVHCVGGRYRKNRRDFCGQLAENAVAGLRFSRAFLGADACETDRGFTTTDFETARLSAAVLASSDKSYVLADNDKFRRTSLVPYAALSAVSGVITDKRPEQAQLEAYTAAGAAFLPYTSKP